MICLDTNVVIAILNDSFAVARERLTTAQVSGDEVCVSALVVFELLYGAAKSIRRQPTLDLVYGFLSGPISVLPFDAEDAKEAGEIRAALEPKGTPIGPYDLLIAAQARRRDALLVTANTREFRRVPHLRIENWSA